MRLYVETQIRRMTFADKYILRQQENTHMNTGLRLVSWKKKSVQGLLDVEYLELLSIAAGL